MPVDPDVRERPRTCSATSRRAGARARRRPASRRCGGCARTRGPGLPRPTTSRSSDEAVAPAPGRRIGRLALGIALVGGALRRRGFGAFGQSRPRRHSRPPARPPRPRRLLGLGLLDARRLRDAREHGLLGVVEQRDARGRSISARRSESPMCIARDVDLDVLGDLERRASTLTSFTTCERTPPTLSRPARRRARPDRGLDRLVEADFLKVDVRDLPAHLVALVVLEDRRVRWPPSTTTSSTACARPRRQRRAEVALADRDRDGSERP